MRFRIGDLEFGSPPQGPAGPLQVESFENPGAEMRSTDRPRLGRDGSTPGRDFLGASTWTFECYTNVRYATQAREVYSALHRIWHHPDTRKRAGSLVALDYEARGTNEWRRVYGRPRNFDPPSGDKFMVQGRAAFGMEFEVLDPRHFSGSEAGLFEHTIEHEGEEVGGVYAPVAAPVSTVGVSGSRAGALQNEGDLDTPLFVTFTGPLRNPRLRSAGGWEVGWNGSLRYDERLEIDPVRHTVTHFNGDGVGTSAFAGFSSRNWQLSRMSIPPGLTNVFFSGVDPTKSSTAVVSWRHAYTSF